MRSYVLEVISSFFFILTSLIVFVTTEFRAYEARCLNKTEISASMLQSSDGVPGRYNTMLCVPTDWYNKWMISLFYYPNTTEDDCVEYDYVSVSKSQLHSSSEYIMINQTCSDASFVCFNKSFDLVFTGCYAVSSRLWNQEEFSNYSNTMHYIRNKLTLATYLSNQPTAKVISNADEMSVVWFSGHIPITHYTLALCPRYYTTAQECTSIKNNCSEEQWSKIYCKISPVVGEYLLKFTHTTDVAWTHGMLRRLRTVTYQFSVVQESIPAEGGGGGAALVSMGAGGAVLALLLLAALLLRRLRTPPLHKYPDHSIAAPLRADAAACEEAGPDSGLGPGSELDLGPDPGPDSGPGWRARVLLLYSSDVQQEGAALRTLLQRNNIEVEDVQSARVAAAAAAAPPRYLHARLRRRHPPVLLLHSPALIQTCAGEGAAWTFGDSLVQLALRFLTDTTTTRLPYRKFFYATLGECAEAGVLRELVPFTRYPLPHTAPALLRALAAPGPAPPAGLEQFAAELAAAAVHL